MLQHRHQEIARFSNQLASANGTSVAENCSNIARNFRVSNHRLQHIRQAFGITKNNQGRGSGLASVSWRAIRSPLCSLEPRPSINRIRASYPLACSASNVSANGMIIEPPQPASRPGTDAIRYWPANEVDVLSFADLCTVRGISVALTFSPGRRSRISEQSMSWTSVRRMYSEIRNAYLSHKHPPASGYIQF